MMVGLPAGRVLRATDARNTLPLPPPTGETITGPVPITVGLGAVDVLMNCTVPVGVPEPGEITVTTAVSVICWPTLDWLALDEIDVAVAALFTVWTSALAPDRGELL